jgi:CheY-like chemotaxis protein
VKLYLPLAEAAAEAPVPAAPAQGTGETILVVENDAHIRGLVVATLRDLGYAGMAAADAEAALPILKSARRIDLLVSDIGLSGMNGRQLADIARQQRPELGVLFITGYPQNAAHHAGLLASGIELITKPFATDALILKIRQMMNR